MSRPILAAGAVTEIASEGDLPVYSSVPRNSLRMTDDNKLFIRSASGWVNVAFEDARVVSAMASANTDGLPEGATNLYYTAARAQSANASALSGKEPTISTGTSLQYYRGDKSFQALNTSAVPELTNLYWTQARFNTALAAKSTTDVSEGTNLYFTNARAVSALSTSLSVKEPTITAGTTLQYYRGDKSFQTLNTAAVPELTNLYFTTARAQSAMSGLYESPIAAGTSAQYYRGDKSFQTLNTTAVVEGSNLYFTTARAQSAMSGLYEPTITIGTSTQYWRGDKTFQTLNTAVVTESTNLYYTSTRFDTAFSGKSTTNLTEGTNLYYTAARFNTAFAAKNTDGLPEGVTNLYFTNARALTALGATAAKAFPDLELGGASAGTNDVLTFKDGHIRSTQTTAPTAAPTAAAGVASTASVTRATDSAGIINLTTGNLLSLTTGIQVNLTFNKTYNVAPIVVITPANALTATSSSNYGGYVNSSTGGFSIGFASLALGAQALSWYYQVVETQ